MHLRRISAIILINFTILLFFPIFLGSQGSWNNSKADLPPDTIIHNGLIITMEPSLAQAEALAIQGDTILAVGDGDEILALAGSNTRIIDLGGKPLLPGFIDAHGHWIGIKWF